MVGVPFQQISAIRDLKHKFRLQPKTYLILDEVAPKLNGLFVAADAQCNQVLILIKLCLSFTSSFSLSASSKVQVTPVRGPRSMKLGSGKVAGKDLIVDHILCSAKLLILVDSVANWRCG